MRDSIAVIGIGCRFPGGASSPRRFWDFLTQGKSAVVEVPKERWDHRRYYDPDPSKPGKTYVRAAGFLEEPIDSFDAAFFGISPREAAVLDPQQRLLAEVAWEAMEDAGLPPDSLAGSATGVYVGGFMLDSMLTHMGPMNRELIGPHTAVGATMTVLSARLSYMFDFRGPSISLDTACSSSLVAVHLACQDLWSKECNLGIAGGVNVMFRPEIFVAMSKGKFLSADGTSKGFDARADGYGRGEGAGLVVLKRYEDAVRDGDRIYAIVRGTGVNQDGRTESMTAPSSTAQEALIRRVCTTAGINPQEIQAFEAHGTGTLVGDPAEMRALGTVSKRNDGTGPWVGSLKANIGHLEAAAGVAGMIKASLCLTNGRLPPQANLRELNPRIPFAELGIKIPRQIEALSSTHGEPLRMGVNSFGYGGTNAHVLLERPPIALAPKKTVAQGPEILALSAKTPEALKQLAARFAELLRAPDHPSISDICYSAALRRSHHEHRLALIAGEDAAGLAQRLASFAEGGPAEDGASGKVMTQSRLDPVFVFTGMGPQWWAMGRELYEQDALFKKTLDECDAIFKRHAGWSLLAQMLVKDEASSSMARTEIAQPANFFLQAGLYAMWRALGLEPAAVVGHSAGEVASAYAGGLLDLEQAILVIYERSRIQAKAAGMGKMLAVGLSEAGAREAIRGREAEVSIAAVNGPSAVTLSGSADGITAIAAELEQKGVFNRILKVEVPYHSPAMDPLKPELMKCLASLKPSLAKIATYSTVTGGRVEGIAYDAPYWCENIRQPTFFAKAAGQLLRDGHRLYLELGPHPVLSASIKECMQEAEIEGRTISSLRRGEPERKLFAKAYCELYVAGANLDFERVYPERGNFVDLPHYPWQRERHWQESEEALTDRKGDAEHPLLGPAISAPSPTWERGLNAQFLPCLPDHRVRGSVVVPGATYVELALAVRRAIGLDLPHMLEDVRFENALVLSGSDEPMVRTSYDEATQMVSIFSRPRDARTAWTRHATARVRKTLLAPPEEYVKLGELDALSANWLNPAQLYDMFKARGLDYGPKLRGLRWLLRDESELLAGIQLPETEAKRLTGDATVSLDPTWLDPCLQAMITLLPDADRRLYLPMGIRSMRFAAPPEPAQALFCHVQIRKRSENSVEGEIALIDHGGRVLARLTGVECTALADQDESALKPAWNDWTYEQAWTEAPLDKPAPVKGGWLVFVDRGEIGLELGKALERAGSTDVVLVAAGDSFVQRSKTSYQVRPGNTEDLAKLLSMVDLSTYGHVAYLWGLDAGAPIASADSTALLTVAVAVAGARATTLHVVTKDAERAVDGDTIGSLGATPLIGLTRVIAAENVGLRCQSIDLSKGVSAGDKAEIERLKDELLAETADTEIALRPGKRLIRKLNAKPLDTWEPRTNAAEASAKKPVFELALDGSEKRPRRATRHAPGKNELEIEVESATLTRGTAVRGRRGSVSPWPIEVGGVITAVGEGVQGFSPGQRVQALLLTAPLAIGTHVVVRVGRDLIGVGAAPGRLLPFLAAETALQAQSRLRPSEKLLVLEDAAGIGFAALELGKAMGAQVGIVLDRSGTQPTAHGEEAETLPTPPEGARIFDRRSSSLAEEIMEWTGQKGVDVLVNAALEPEATIAGVLGPFGRFVDASPLAPADGLFANAWARGASCSRVELMAMLVQRPKEAAARIAAVLERLEYLPGSAVERFPAAKGEEALRLLGERARERGVARVTLAFNTPAPASLAPGADERLFDANSTYLVTGGFGGFGLALARWMVAEGAKNLVLTGRKGAVAPDAKALVAELEKAGARVYPAAVDVADAAAMKAMFQKLDAEFPPLKGVMHTAAVLDDAPLVELNGERMEKVIGPKARGAWILHELTKDRKLDFFVLYSSVSSLIGNPRQGNYVAANAFLDALAEHRAALGLPATAVQWGVLDQLGMTLDASVRNYLASLGLIAMAPAAVLEALGKVLRVQPAGIGVVDVRWSVLGRSAPHLLSSSRTEHLIGDSGQGSEEDGYKRKLAKMASAERTGELQGFLTERLAAILQLPADRIDAQKALPALGVDSLLAMQVQATIRQQLGLELPALELLRGASLSAVAGRLSSMMEGGGAPAAAAPAAAPKAPEAQIERQVESMSESEVDSILRAMLEAQEARP
ncbi:MAG: SDR family NAD(P)-dependent oxidoreductase [Myxococcota bacterium]